MKQKKQFLIFILSATFVCQLVSCKKEKNEDNTTLTQLQGKKWKVVSITASNDYDNSIIDFYSMRDSCVNDNLYTFISGGMLQIDNNSIKCSSNEPQVSSGSWTYYDNKKELWYYSDMSNTILTITSINDQVLSGVQRIPILSINYIYVWTFNKW